MTGDEEEYSSPPRDLDKACASRVDKEPPDWLAYRLVVPNALRVNVAFASVEQILNVETGPSPSHSRFKEDLAFLRSTQADP